MKLKKGVKKTLISVLLIVLIVIGGIFVYKQFFKKEKTKEIKVVDNISKYGYKLKENKPEKYKKMFGELKEILSKDKVDEEAYVKKISEMFVYDFYSLDDKLAKTDIGGVDFVYSGVMENFLTNAQDTYYKYVESNIYNNRNQQLPRVDEVEVKEIEKVAFDYTTTNEAGEKQELSDPEAYKVKVEWTYTTAAYDKYQSSATLTIVHIDNKLYVVECL